jgi:hypothetical protein
MTNDEVIKALSEGRRWFTNGGKRWRYVHGIEGFYVVYTTGSGGTTYEDRSSFYKWAKGAYSEKIKEISEGAGKQ